MSVAYPPVTDTFVKWTLFLALLMSVPTLFFLVQVIFFIPAIFYVSGIGYVVVKAFTPPNFGEDLVFIVILGIHLLIYGAIYFVVSVILAKLICFLRAAVARALVLALICLGLFVLTFFPFYGGGGHGPMTIGPLSEMASLMERDYGPYALEVIYGPALLIPVYLFFDRWRRAVAGAGQEGEPPP